MCKNKMAIILLSVILIVAEINQICFAFPSILDDVPERQILTTETSAGVFSDNNSIRAFRLLNYLGIISENEKDFEEDAAITRANAVSAFAALFAGFRASGTAETFSDVPTNHAYAAGIWQAVEFGILDGSQSKFYPNKNASYDDVATWALKALRFDVAISKKQPVAVASDMGIFKGINITGSVITAGQFLRILENVLNTDLVDMNLSGNGFSYEMSNSQTYLSSKYDVLFQEGILTGYKYSSIYGDTGMDDNEVQINRASYRIDEELSVDYVGYSVGAYIDRKKDDKIITLWRNEGKNTTYEVEKKDYVSFDESNVRYANSKRIRLDSGIRMMRNDIFDGYYNTAAMGALQASDKIVVVDNNGDGKGDLLKVYQYTYYYVKSVSALSEVIVFGNDAGTQDIDDSVMAEFFFEGKLVDPFTDLKANDILTVLEGTGQDGKKVFCAQISRDIIEGNISMIGTDNIGKYYVIDGTYYYLSDSIISYMTANSLNQEVGDFVQAYISTDKRIVRIKSEGDMVFGYLMEAKYKNRDSELIITVYTMGGEIEKLTSEEKVRVYNQSNQTGKKMYALEAYNECLNPDGSVKDVAVGYMLDSAGKLKQIVFEVPKASVSSGVTYPLTLDLDYNPSGASIPEARAYHGIFGNKWTFDSTIPVLTIPTDDSLKADPKAYSKTTGNKWGKSDGSYLKNGEVIKAYNSDKFWRPKFYTVKTPVTTTISQSDGSVHFCVIDKICNVYDEEEGGEIKMLSYYAGTQYKDVKISGDVTIARPGVFCNVTNVDDLQKGDVIQIHTDAVGSIDVLTVYFRINDPPANGFGTYYFDTDSDSLVYSTDVVMAAISVVYARVVDVDSNKALLATSDGTEFPVTIGGYSSYGDPYYLLYEKGSKTAQPAKLADIKTNDIVVMRKYYNHVQDVIIVKN